MLDFLVIFPHLIKELNLNNSMLMTNGVLTIAKQPLTSNHTPPKAARFFECHFLEGRYGSVFLGSFTDLG